MLRTRIYEFCHVGQTAEYPGGRAEGRSIPAGQYWIVGDSGKRSPADFLFRVRQKKSYKKIPIHEQVEVLAFTGNIVQREGKPMLHAHVVVGKADGTAHGGHFLGGRVWPTLEMIVTEMPVHLRRTPDAESGLALINLAA